jgi:hypothetical protein
MNQVRRGVKTQFEKFAKKFWSAGTTAGAMRKWGSQSWLPPGAAFSGRWTRPKSCQRAELPAPQDENPVPLFLIRV